MTPPNFTPQGADVALDRIRTIPVGKGKVCTVDEADFADLSRFSWFLTPRGYVFRTEYRGDLCRRYHSLHRQIMGLTHGDKRCVDHINGDRLDNRRSNLRVCTYQENQRNVGRVSRNKSGFKGVCWYSRERKWVAKITADKRTRVLGYFDDPELAREVYCLAADLLHGEFANYGDKHA